MKKLLSFLSSISLITSGSTTVVSCNLIGPINPIENIDKVLVGYYYDWGGEAQVKPSFEEIANTNYNVIDISFLYSPTAYTMPVFQPQNPAEMKAGIKLLQSKGKKVLISMGGATGSEMRFRSDQKN